MGSNSLSNKTMDENIEDFELVYTENSPVILNYMLGRTSDLYLSQDLTSKVFEKAWRTRANFKTGSIKAWLFKIANTTLIDHWRKHKDISIDTSEVEIVADVKPIDQVIDQNLSIEVMIEALNKLPSNLRKILILRFILNNSVRQAARKLDMTESNVRVSQFRALKILKKEIQND